MITVVDAFSRADDDTIVDDEVFFVISGTAKLTVINADKSVVHLSYSKQHGYIATVTMPSITAGDSRLFGWYPIRMCSQEIQDAVKPLIWMHKMRTREGVE